VFIYCIKAYLATKNRLVAVFVIPLLSIGGVSIVRGIQAYYSVGSCFGGFDCADSSVLALKIGLSLVLIGIGVISVNGMRKRKGHSDVAEIS
jgi:hypothetical protein